MDKSIFGNSAKIKKWHFKTPPEADQEDNEILSKKTSQGEKKTPRNTGNKNTPRNEKMTLASLEDKTYSQVSLEETKSGQDSWSDTFFGTLFSKKTHNRGKNSSKNSSKNSQKTTVPLTKQQEIMLKDDLSFEKSDSEASASGSEKKQKKKKIPIFPNSPRTQNKKKIETLDQSKHLYFDDGSSTQSKHYYDDDGSSKQSKHYYDDDGSTAQSKHYYDDDGSSTQSKHLYFDDGSALDYSLYLNLDESETSGIGSKSIRSPYTMITLHKRPNRYYETYSAKELYDILYQEASDFEETQKTPKDSKQALKRLEKMAPLFVDHFKNIKSPEEFHALYNVVKVMSVYYAKISNGNEESTINTLILTCFSIYTDKKLSYDLAFFEETLQSVRKKMEESAKNNTKIENVLLFIKLKKCFPEHIVTLQISGNSQTYKNLYHIFCECDQYIRNYADEDSKGKLKEAPSVVTDAIQLLTIRKTGTMRSGNLNNVINGLLSTFEVDFPTLQLRAENSRETDPYKNLTGFLQDKKIILTQSQGAFLQSLPPAALALIHDLMSEAYQEINSQIIQEKSRKDVAND